MKSELQTRLGRRVKALRTARDETQEQLAERCGFTVKFISGIERGLVNVPLATLGTVARGLGVSVAELALGIDGPLPKDVRRLDQLLAGKSRRHQEAIVRLLGAVNDLVEPTDEPDA